MKLLASADDWSCKRRALARSTHLNWDGMKIKTKKVAAPCSSLVQQLTMCQCVCDTQRASEFCVQVKLELCITKVVSRLMNVGAKSLVPKKEADKSWFAVNKCVRWCWLVESLFVQVCVCGAAGATIAPPICLLFLSLFFFFLSIYLRSAKE